MGGSDRAVTIRQSMDKNIATGRNAFLAGQSPINLAGMNWL
jgi:hypothetical protein